MREPLEGLAEWMAGGPICLVLGAGASVSSGGPTGVQLRNELVEQLDKSLGFNRSLEDTAEILEIDKGRRPLFDAVRARFRNLSPTGGLLALGNYDWDEIYTTNYDKLVEAAYNHYGRRWTSVRSPHDFPGLDDPDATPIFKIHGCISQDRSIGSPSSIVITGSDYREAAQWREQVLRRLSTSLETKKALVIGQSLADRDLRDLIDDAARLQDSIGRTNRIAVLLYEDDDRIADVYRRRHIRVFSGSIESLFAELADQAAGSRVRAQPANSADFPLPDSVLPHTIDVAHARSLPSDPERMFAGAPATYADAACGLTFARDAAATIRTRLRNAPVVTVVGLAGVGKTSLVRQVAVAEHDSGVHCWEHRAGLPLNATAWADVDRRLVDSELRGLLVLDDVTLAQKRANQLVERLSAADQSPFGLRVLATAETHQWRRRVKSRSFFERGDPVEIGSLSGAELRQLNALLDGTPSVAQLASQEFRRKTPERRVSELREACSADMFVSLRNIFEFSSLDDIILGEFNQLDERERDIYRHIALLEAAGVRPHRQLIIRLLGLSLDEVIAVGNDLEGVLNEFDYSNERGIYIWRTRHPVIARIIADFKFSDPDEHSAMIESVVDNLNGSVDLERESVRELCNSEYGIRKIREIELRIELINKLVETSPRDNVIRHRLVGAYLDQPDLHKADVALQRAIRDVGIDPPLHRYGIRLLRQRADALDSPLSEEDRRSLLRQAWEAANEGVGRFATNYYSYFELDRVARDWLSRTGDADWLAYSVRVLETAYSDLLEPEVLSRAQASERLLREADRR